MLSLGHLIYLVLKAMELSLTTFALLMPCQQGMDLYVDYYFSIKVQEIEETLRKGVGVGVQLCLLRNQQRFVSLSFILWKHFLWYLGQKLLMIFPQQGFGSGDLHHAHGQSTCQVSQGMNEYLSFQLFFF